MLSRRMLVVRYAAFAVLATAINLLVQRLVLAGGSDTIRFVIAVGAGTLAGLVTKYALDKKWIFYDDGRGLRAHGQKFSLYMVAGLATTAIFWGFETLFWLASHHAAMRELGAIIGLAIGYVVKYRLDRRFVFTDARIA